MKRRDHESHLEARPAILLALPSLSLPGSSLAPSSRCGKPTQDGREACRVQGRDDQIWSEAGLPHRPQPRPQVTTRETNHSSFSLSSEVSPDFSYGVGLSGGGWLVPLQFQLCVPFSPIRNRTNTSGRVPGRGPEVRQVITRQTQGLGARGFRSCPCQVMT